MPPTRKTNSVLIKRSFYHVNTTKLSGIMMKIPVITLVHLNRVRHRANYAWNSLPSRKASFMATLMEIQVFHRCWCECAVWCGISIKFPLRRQRQRRTEGERRQILLNCQSVLRTRIISLPLARSTSNFWDFQHTMFLTEVQSTAPGIIVLISFYDRSNFMDFMLFCGVAWIIHGWR